MFLKRVSFENIRNHTRTLFLPEKGLNIFYGKNGAGKTSILEAISIICLTKSFVTNYDHNIVTIGQNYYSIEVDAESDKGIPIFVKILYQIRRKKEIINCDGSSLDARDHIGRLPVVILNPPMRDLIFGSPNTRREFIDRTISQVSRSYLNDLLRFRKILKQRNKFLFDYAASNTGDITLFDVWSGELIKYSAKIIFKRIEFIKNFLPFFTQSFSELSRYKEEASIIYKPFSFPKIFNEEESSILAILWEQFTNIKQLELKKGLTLFGPQKDDFHILLNNRLAKEVASQGQSKSLLIALKYAEMKFYELYISTTPIILLDDIFSELDNERIEQVMKLITKDRVQTFITLTDLSFLSYFEKKDIPFKIFFVEEGSCKDLPKNKIKEFYYGN